MNPERHFRLRSYDYQEIYRINKKTGATEKKRILGGGLNNEMKRQGWKLVAKKGKRVY